jgi:hypothetical protein
VKQTVFFHLSRSREWINFFSIFPYALMIRVISLLCRRKSDYKDVSLGKIITIEGEKKSFSFTSFCAALTVVLI